MEIAAATETSGYHGCAGHSGAGFAGLRELKQTMELVRPPSHLIGEDAVNGECAPHRDGIRH